MSSSAARTSYHHGDLRNALLDAASDAARDSGADALSLREVARRAGVSHTAAYNHFADKNDLLRGLAIRAFEQLATDLRAVTDDPSATLADTAVAYLRFAWSHGAEFRFMFQRSLCLPPGVDDPLEHASRGSQQVLRDQLVALQASGDIRPGDTEALLLVLWAQVHGFTTIVLETPVFKALPLADAEHLMRQGVQSVLDGIAA